MTEIDALYQDVILDHYKHPRNWGTLDAPPARKLEGHNPLCGDRMTVYVQVAGDVVQDVRIDGSGCAISVASASLMTEAVKGKPIAEVLRLFERFHDVVTGKIPDDASSKLKVFAGVAEYPARVKCATLAWHTVKSALQSPDANEPVTTE